MDLVKRLEELEATWRGAVRFEFWPERAEQIRQLALELRREAMQECAEICRNVCNEAWKRYKIGFGPQRADPRTEGFSDGAEACEKDIRARMEKE